MTGLDLPILVPDGAMGNGALAASAEVDQASIRRPKGTCGALGPSKAKIATSARLQEWASGPLQQRPAPEMATGGNQQIPNYPF